MMLTVQGARYGYLCIVEEGVYDSLWGALGLWSNVIKVGRGLEE
jgi:hypothetical protein